MTTIEEQLQIHREAAKKEAFTRFLDETTGRIGEAQWRGYTAEQAIELLKLYALQGIEQSIMDRQ